MEHINKKALYLVIILILSQTFYTASCTSSEMIRLRKSIKEMSDTELINYYYGINERIKDVANDQERKADMDNKRHEHIIINQTFFPGGEGHGLLQKRELALDELIMRGISVKRYK